MSDQTQSYKFAATILQNLPEVPRDVAQKWIENPRQLQRVLKVLAEIPSDPKGWKQIILGTGIKDTDGFRNAIKDGGMLISDWANDIIGKPAFNMATEKGEVDLVVVSVVELGFKEGAKIKDIYAAAKKRGLELCPNEVGPQLRLQYQDQPKDEWLIIGMKPITDSGGVLRVFEVGCLDGGLWISATSGSPDNVRDGTRRFVFVLPRK